MGRMGIEAEVQETKGNRVEFLIKSVCVYFSYGWLLILMAALKEWCNKCFKNVNIYNITGNYILATIWTSKKIMQGSIHFKKNSFECTWAKILKDLGIEPKIFSMAVIVPYTFSTFICLLLFFTYLKYF